MVGTAFAGPVVPEVKLTVWTSHGSSGGSRTGRSGDGRSSASGATTEAPIASSRCAAGASATATVAATVRHTCSSISPLRAGFVGTRVAPRNAVPHQAARNCGPFSTRDHDVISASHAGALERAGTAVRMATRLDPRPTSPVVERHARAIGTNTRAALEDGVDDDTVPIGSHPAVPFGHAAPLLVDTWPLELGPSTSDPNPRGRRGEGPARADWPRRIP